MKHNSHNFDVKTVYFNLHYITTIKKKSIVLFVLLFRRRIKSGFQCPCVLHSRGKEESPPLGSGDHIYCMNCARTHNSHNVQRDFQSERWWTFQGYYLFCFINVVFSVVVALLGVFSFTAISRSYLLFLSI